MAVSAPNSPMAYVALEAGSEPLSHVTSVLCLLGPRLLVTAGFNSEGVVQAMRCSSYDVSKPVWNAEFFEKSFLNEPLLADPSLVKVVAIADDRVMAVPESAYEPEQVVPWMQSVYFLLPDEDVLVQPVGDSPVNVAGVWPSGIKEIAERYFGDVYALPLAAALMGGTEASGTILRLALTAPLATGALFVGDKLHWLGTIPYETAEDIAYGLHAIFRDKRVNINGISVEGGTSTSADTRVLNEVLAYFPEATLTTDQALHHPAWGPVLFLMRRLWSCVL